MKIIDKLAKKIKKCLIVSRSKLFGVPSFYSLLFHRKELLFATPDVANVTPINSDIDGQLISRIIVAYKKLNREDIGNSMWKNFYNTYHQHIHDILINGDNASATEIFRNPAENDLFYGFDILTKSFIDSFKKKGAPLSYAKVCLDGLLRFAEAVGICPLDNKESWNPANLDNSIGTEEIIKKIDQSLAWSFSFPNPFPHEPGLYTSRGVVSYRVPQAIYQAWIINEHVKGIKNPRILEIGGGLGRTAYYAYEIGLKDYTIIDLPITSAAQTYFLGRTLGQENLILEGEDTDGLPNDKIKILSPKSFLGSNQIFDLIINVDSMTEMDISVARKYWGKIKQSTKKFISINHESNPFRVKDIISDDRDNFSVQRKLYWMRYGYVEEIININS